MAGKLLFSSAIQPSIISLFSSTASHPLALFSVSNDKSLPADSFVHFLHDRLSNAPPDSPKVLLHLPGLDGSDARGVHARGRELEQTVLHIQSPTVPSTYIQCPPNLGSSERSTVLGIKLPWIHIQVRDLCKEWSFEVGLVDQAGRVGIARFSTFQAQSRLLLHQTQRELPSAPRPPNFIRKDGKRPRLKTRAGALPLLLLPLSFPTHTAHRLTAWSTIAIHLPSILPHFSSPHLLATDRPAHPSPSAQLSLVSVHVLPAGTFAHVSYVRVYANCRLRRIWFSEGGPSQPVPWEFELYGREA